MAEVAPDLLCVTEGYFLDMHKTCVSLQQSRKECCTSNSLMRLIMFVDTDIF